MKKLSAKMLTILGMAAIIFASSCGKDDDDPKPDATITFAADSPQANNSSVTPGATITFKFTANDPEKRMRALRIMRNNSPIIPTSAGGLAINKATGVITAGNNQTFLGEVQFTAEPNTGTYTYVIQILDNTDASKAAVIGSTSVTIIVAVAAPALKSATAIVLGAQLNSNPSFFSATTLRRYGSCLILGTGANCTGSNADSIAVVDIRFAQVGNPTTQPQFVSPNSTGGNGGGLTPVSGGRVTYFATSSLDFDNVTPAQIDSINVGTSNLFIKVTNNTTYAFQTADGKKGLIKVTALDNGTGGAGSVDGSVTFDLKVQE